MTYRHGEGESKISPLQAAGSARGASVGAACQSLQRALAGLCIKSDRLHWHRETVIDSMVDRGPYGQIESCSGCIDVEVLPGCILSESVQEEIARAMAAELLPTYIRVDEWETLRVGNWICLTPESWIESERDYRPAVAQEPREGGSR